MKSNNDLKQIPDNDITVNSFKCLVNPLLQCGTVAQKKVGEIEKNYKINLDLNLGDSIKS
jgi:hypothetical protein